MPKLLSQTSSVDALLSLLLEATEYIQDDNLKNRMKAAVEIYNHAITPSTIYLSEVIDLAKVNNISITKQDALDILTNAANDIDLNYASKSIEFQFNEFVNSH